MKQNFYFKFVFLSLLMMVMGLGNAFAEDTWVKTDPAKLTTGDIVMIVDLGSSRAMSNDKGTSALPDAIYLYFTDDNKTESTGTKDNIVPETLQWVVTVDNGSFKFGVNGTSKYLYCTNANNGLHVGTNSNNTFTIEESSGKNYLKNAATSRYVGVYNSQDWRCYTSTSTNISNTNTAFFKKVESTTPTTKTLTGISLGGDYKTEFNVGEEFSFGGTVTATYDDGSTKDVTNRAEFDGNTTEIAGELLVTVSYTEGNVTKTTSYSITVSEVVLTGDTYTLVTDGSNLRAGDKVIIVSYDGSKAMSTTQNNNNRGATDVSIEDTDAFVPSETDIQVFTLEGNATNGWYFNTGNGYIYAASSDKNYLKTETEKDDNARANISISDGEATIKFQGTNARNLLKYNSGSDLFSCYASGQQPVRIYKNGDSVSPTKVLTDITLSGEYPTAFNVGDKFAFGGTVTATYEDETTKDVTDEAVFSGYDMNAAGNQTVTVSYTEGEVMKTKTYEITVNTVVATGITLDTNEATILVGNTRALKATIEPENATNKNVTWHSNNESIATVDENGIVTAVALGEAVITAASAENAYIATTCTVTVVDELDGATATGNLNNSETGVFVGVVGFSTGTNSASGTLGTEVGDVTVDYSSSPNSYLNNTYIRMYQSGSTLKFTAPTGYDLTEIVFTKGSTGNLDNMDADKGTYSSGTWTGAESEVTFTGKSATLYLTTAEVTLEKAAPKAALVSIEVEGQKSAFVVNDTFDFGGTVTATYEDETTKDVTAEATFSGYDLSTTGEQTVTVSYTEGEVTKTTEYTITVREPETVTFRKISSTDDLVAGKRYVLVNEENQKVMAEYYNLHFEVNGATISDEKVTLTEGDANFLTLGGAEGAWTFATSIEPGKYLYFNTPGNSSNYLEPSATDTADGAKWTISFDESGNAVIQSNYNKETDNPDRYIRFNSNDNQLRFTTYRGTDNNPYGSQQPVQLYVEVDENDVQVTITEVGYATLFYSDRALKVPAGVTAKTYKVASGKLAESKTYKSGSVIPGGEAVVLKGAAGTYDFYASTTTEAKDTNSMLKGTDEAEETTGGIYYYALQAKAKDGTGGPGMYWMNSTGVAFTNGAHKAYMALDEMFDTAQEIGGARSFYLFEDTTGIGNVQADGIDVKGQRFNMSGQRVGNNYKGIVIVNGKKFMQK